MAIRYTPLLTLLLLAILPGAVAQSLTDGIQIYYSFDNLTVSAGNTLDLGPDKNNGSIQGTVTTGQPGILAQAFSFNGGTDVIIANSSVNGSLTQQFWINLTSTATTASSCQILAQGRTAQPLNSYRLANCGSPTDTVFRIYQGGAPNTWFDYNTTVLPQLNGSTWNHIILVWNATNSSVRLWVNGIDRGNGNPLGLPVAPTEWDVLRIGNDHLGTGYNGLIDEVAYWNRTLNSTEIQQLYNNGTGFNPYTILVTVSPVNPPNLDFTNNVTVTYTYTVATNGGASNCSLLVNGSNATSSPLNQPDGTRNLNYTPGDGVHTWSVQCTADGQTASTDNRTLTVDSTMPAWTLQPNNLFAFANDTIINRALLGNLFTLNLSADNIALNATNVTILYPNTSVFYNDQRLNLVTTEENITATLDFTGEPQGQYDVILYAIDDLGNSITQLHNFEINDGFLPVTTQAAIGVFVFLFAMAILLAIFREQLVFSPQAQKLTLAAFAIISIVAIVVLLAQI